MTTRYTEEQREKALNILTDEGYFEVMTLEDFMTAYEPYQIARKVKGSDLTLECNYLRINGYYSLIVPCYLVIVNKYFKMVLRHHYQRP